jgi:GNAT superfamily N-acetyltransferase
MSLDFRRATGADLPIIIQMIADDQIGQKREDTSVPLNPSYLAAFEAIQCDDNQFLAVAERDGQVIGCLQLTFIPGISRMGMWRGNIESVRVAKSLRGQGIGRTFFEWAIDMCRQRGCKLVQLTMDKSRKDASRFYQSLGFTPSHEGMKLSL